jgi:hypothetical protein
VIKLHESQKGMVATGRPADFDLYMNSGHFVKYSTFLRLRSEFDPDSVAKRDAYKQFLNNRMRGEHNAS